MKQSYKNFTILENQKELMFTPDESAQKIMDWILPQIDPKDTVLESFCGNSVFYKKIPNKKYFCEIDKGINFFDFDKKVDWVISNPPFRILHENKPINAFILIIDKTMKICNKGFFYLINHKLWASLTVKRINQWKKNNWVIAKIFVIEIKKWYGRYYVIKFEKNGKSILEVNC